MLVESITMTKAQKNNVRAYLQARCLAGDVRKYKLLVEVTRKQSVHYLSIIQTILKECSSKIAKGLKFQQVKAMARDRRAELLG